MGSRGQSAGSAPSATLAEHIEDYIGGGYTVAGALTPSELNFVKKNMKETSQTLFRIEEDFFMADRLKVGETFSFNDDIKSFTKGDQFIKETLNPKEYGVKFGDYAEFDSPVVYKTVGSTKAFDVEPYAKEYEKATGVNQREAWAGGKFEVKKKYKTKMAGRNVTVIEIKQR